MLKTLLISVLMSAAILGSSTLVYVNGTSAHRTAHGAAVLGRDGPALPAAAAPARSPARSRDSAFAAWMAHLDR